jgi:hypothetical protein
MERLPRGFQTRLIRVSQVTGDPPEHVLDRGLRSEEVQAGLVIDKSLEREAVSAFHRRVAERTAKDLGEEGRLVRSRLGAAGKHAKRTGVSIEAYLEQKARELGMTVDSYLRRPQDD